MDRIRRNERLAAMTRILVESPNKIFTLGTFCEMFGAAKSTLSEDIDILRGVFAQFHLGQLDTVTGAAGGVRYRPALAPEDAYRTVKDLAQMLARARGAFCRAVSSIWPMFWRCRTWWSGWARSLPLNFTARNRISS